MAKLKITTSREVDLSEVNDMLDNIWRDQSPWVGSISPKAEGKWKIRYDGPLDDEGSWASTKIVTAEDLVKAFQTARDASFQVLGAGKGHGGLCCLETMEKDELGLGCAQDHDTVLQYALLGELVYG